MRTLQFFKMLVHALAFVVAATTAEAAEHINPARAQVIDSGKSPTLTLVYVHGVFHGSWAFEELQPRLELPGRAHALVDLRGHYGQQRLSADSMVGYEDYLDDLNRLLEEIDGSKVLIGHSLGGMLSISVSERRDVLGVVLLAVPLPEVLMAERWRLLMKNPLLSMGMVFFKDPSMLYHDVDFARRYLIDEDTPDQLFQKTLRHIQSQQEPYQLFQDLQSLELDLAAVRKPTLVIYGTEDPTVDEEAANLLAGPLGTEAIPVEGASHGVMFMPGHAQMVANTINHWLSDIKSNFT